jgi:hypothetical protein
VIDVTFGLLGTFGIILMKLDLKALPCSVKKQEDATRMIQRILMVLLDLYAVLMRSSLSEME